MPNGVCSTNYSTIRYTSLEVIFFLMVFDFFHEICREYVGMFLHPIDVSLAESFNLVSNVWHIEIMSTNDCGICFAIFVVFLYLSWRLCPTIGRHKPTFKNCLVQQQFIFDRQFAAEQPVHFAQSNSKLFSLVEYVPSSVYDRGVSLSIWRLRLNAISGTVEVSGFLGNLWLPYAVRL